MYALPSNDTTWDGFKTVVVVSVPQRLHTIIVVVGSSLGIASGAVSGITTTGGCCSVCWDVDDDDDV